MSTTTLAQKVFLDIGSGSGDIGDVISVPVQVTLPPGSLTWTSCQGKFVLSDPSVGQIIGASSITGVSLNATPSEVFFASTGLNTLVLTNGLFMTIDVKIASYGCTSIVPERINVQTPFDFVIDNITYDLDNDFVVTNGSVCGDCPLHIQSVTGYPNNTSTTPNFENVSGNAIGNYENFTSNCIPVNSAPLLGITASQGNVYISIYLDVDGLPGFEVLALSTFSSTGAINIALPPGGINFDSKMRIMVSDSPIAALDEIPTCGEVEDYQFCPDCDCDLNDVTLGDIAVVSTQSCPLFGLNVPISNSCSGNFNESFFWEVFDADGDLVYSTTTTNNGTNYPFPTEGEFTIVVTYTVTDANGCALSFLRMLRDDFTGCACDCDLDDITLGDIAFVPSQTCPFIGVTVPIANGCNGSTDVFDWEVFNGSGNLVYSIQTNNNGFPYAFPIQSTYTFVLTYTVTDADGCAQTITRTGTFDFTGCGCWNVAPPVNLNCSFPVGPKGGSSKVLSWDPVVGAVFYEIEFTNNDPDCCATAGPITTSIQPWASTSYSFNNTRCFSWRVRAVCGDGSRSAWSAKGCTCGLLSSGSGGPKKRINTPVDAAQGTAASVPSVNITMAPNPVEDFMVLTLNDLSGDLGTTQAQVAIYSLTGQEVYRDAVNFETENTIDLSNLGSGVYLVRVTTNDQLVSTQKLMVK
ncbi:MAG: T9SS type A sorting domain-containing protein [Salibacteraceae bacterium]